jgi:hypothetical protein
VTLEQVWGLYKTLTAPTPRPVKLAKRAWQDLRASAGLVNDLVPARKEGDAQADA